MRIGEFAKASGLPASVLRLYDKKGLLVPDYIDNFTGYRHYSAAQIETVRRINLLKQAGFSLKEIHRIIEDPENKKLMENVLKRHEADCRSMLGNLQEVKKVMLKKKEEEIQENGGFTEEEKDGRRWLSSAPMKTPLAPPEFQKTCDLLEEEAARRDDQRVSGFLTEVQEDGKTACVAIEIVKLEKEFSYLGENIDLPFENDERVIGKWEVLREYAVKDDFYTKLSEGRESNYGNKAHELYFLPGGESYWIYGWTKDHLTLNSGNEKWVCRYEIEEHEGETYMFLEEKGYEFRRGGRPTVVVLKQADQKAYTRQEIAIEDDLNIPFENDDRVLGTWNTYDCVRHKEDFQVGKRRFAVGTLPFKKMRFEKDGVLTSWYEENEIGPDRQSWTKGYILRAYNHTACAYEIVNVDGRDYMIMEWKSGDYRWGGYVTNYYVMERDV